MISVFMIYETLSGPLPCREAAVAQRQQLFLMKIYLNLKMSLSARQIKRQNPFCVIMRKKCKLRAARESGITVVG